MAGFIQVCHFIIILLLFILFHFIILFLAALGLCCCARGATLRCSARASHCDGFSCCGARALGARASVVVACRLSSCGTWAQLLCGMWDLPRPGLEPVSPALAGGFLTTVPQGKSLLFVFYLVPPVCFVCLVPLSCILLDYSSIFQNSILIYLLAFAVSLIFQWLLQVLQYTSLSVHSPLRGNIVPFHEKCRSLGMIRSIYPFPCCQSYLMYCILYIL